jgi:tetratricopeptide (TPR) repeat protein
MNGLDWLTAIGILLSGAVIGFMFLYTTTKKSNGPASEAGGTAAARPLAVRDLEARLDVLIAQLRELADIGGSDAERALLERQAADVLRQLDGLAPASPVPVAAGARQAASVNQPAPVAVPQPAGALRGFLWGIASAAAIAGLVFFVINQAKARDAGGSVTGGTTMGSAPMQSPSRQQPQAPDAELQKVEAAAQASPDDLSARNDLAHAYLERGNMVGAFEQAQAVLAKAPSDPRANTVQGIVRIAMGESEQAIPQLQAATRSDPKLTDSWVALAWAYTQSGRDDDAGKAIDAGVKENPSQEARMREVLVKMREQAKGQAASPRHPAPDGNAPAATPAATSGGDGKGVRITLSIAPGATVPDSKVLFVIARAAGQTSGPPTAVKRVIATGFPISVDLTAADSMMGQPLPAKMRIEARLDTDGNAMTKEPTDLTASKDGVASGDAVALVLGNHS